MRDIIYIKNEFVSNDTLGNEAICILAVLNSITHKGCNNYYMSYNEIGYYLFGRLPSLRERERVINGIKELIDKKYISVSKAATKTEFIFDLTKLHDSNKKEYYMSIKAKELQKIMNIRNPKDKYKIFRYFVCLTGTFNKSSKIEDKYRGKIGFMNQRYLCQLSNVNVDTLREYNKILEENKLIYIVRHTGDYKKYVNADGESRVSYISNTYSRYEDRKLCDEYATKAGGININKFKAKVDHSRSLKQKYNAMLKGKIYSDDVVAEIYEYILEINEKRKDNGEILLDMSVFEQYKLK